MLRFVVWIGTLKSLPTGRGKSVVRRFTKTIEEMRTVTLGLCPWEAFYHENAGTRPSYARARGVPVAPKGNALLALCPRYLLR